MITIVTGIGRSGTSLVAGTLHRLGVHMGDDFVPTDSANPAGYFEDQAVIDLLRCIIRGIGDFQDHVMALSAHLRALRDPGGFKAPTLTHDLGGGSLWSLVEPVLPPHRVIIARRDLLAACASFRSHYGADGWGLLSARERHAEDIARRTGALEVDYEDALAHPRRAVERIAAFAGISPSAQQIDEAVAAIRVALPSGPRDDGVTGYIQMAGGALP